MTTGKWFAPPSGGYSGRGPNGEVVERHGPPPKIPATAEGVRARAAAHAAFVAARVEPTNETMRVGPPWARRTRTEYSVVLEPAPVSVPQPERAGFVPPPPPLSVLRILWADDDDEAEALACEVLEVTNRRAAADAARLARVRTVRAPR